MMKHSIVIPDPQSIRNHMLSSLNNYWNGNRKLVENLPIKTQLSTRIELPLRMLAVELPYWASKCGVDGKILIPQECAVSGMNWSEVDWYLASFLLLESVHEQFWEIEFGNI